MQTSILPYVLKFPAPTRDLHPPSPSVHHVALAQNHESRVLAMWEILVNIRPSYIYHTFCEACPDDPFHHITISSEGSLHISCEDTNEPKHTPPSISLNEDDQRLFVKKLAQWDWEEEMINTVTKAGIPPQPPTVALPSPPRKPPSGILPSVRAPRIRAPAAPVTPVQNTVLRIDINSVVGDGTRSNPIDLAEGEEDLEDDDEGKSNESPIVIE
ncbi:hypothetical protein K435DRAFT_860915 [Dendrothele bispora CBS 962.96]|uniref:Uncharacterized protein n=1 Tax=Dendrothele bispora (strain CBS 962.96) TaxID=1314807 RepID=A0A4S8LXZ2_DENBC|nr:hypothetical protein K435DRAFT_860915 [Dendrothele bispora CBS 962.96]